MVIKFLKSAFSKTASIFADKLRKILGRNIDEETLDYLYQLLYEADFGTQTVSELISLIESEHKKNSKLSPDEMIQLLKNHLISILKNCDSTLNMPTSAPSVFMIIGVNGNGKTTSCAKIAHFFQQQGKSVLLGACDTFRAAAVNQLTLWSEKLKCDLVKGQMGADPAAVVYDSLEAACSRHRDVLLIDTAGRLHTKTHLMQELEKMRRVLKKKVEDAPHETLLVVDATTGQNAIEQAKTFHEFTPISGLILSKYDGTAKGGTVVAIQRELGIPVKFLGIGEKMEDLVPFDPQKFISDLFGA